MAGMPASQAIFFIASIIIASVVVVALYGTTGSLSGAVVVRNSHLTDQLKSEIVIINDPAASSHPGVYVLNTGKTSLDNSTDTIALLVNGVYQTILTSDIENDDGDLQWDPSEVVNLTISGVNPAGKSIKVVVANGVSDTEQL
jgi:flagellar protein FlaG